MVFKALGVVHAVEKLKVRPASNETNASATLNGLSAIGGYLKYSCLTMIMNRITPCLVNLLDCR